LKKSNPIIAVRDLETSSKWLQAAFEGRSKHGGNKFDVVVFKNNKLLRPFVSQRTLLKNFDKILIQQTENVRAARQIRFTNVKEIDGLETPLKAYVFEAIEIEKAGLEVPIKKTSEFMMPDEFNNALYDNDGLKTAFKMLSLGRQRGYLLYFSQPKLSKTRKSRIEKCTKKILEGKGIKR